MFTLCIVYKLHDITANLSVVLNCCDLINQWQCSWIFQEKMCTYQVQSYFQASLLLHSHLEETYCCSTDGNQICLPFKMQLAYHLYLEIIICLEFKMQSVSHLHLKVIIVCHLKCHLPLCLEIIMHFPFKMQSVKCIQK